ncbi:uncharacterized protein [Nicotiana sylvestris]|uniref:uncharacterized protein n=1 Tax=Nicotiana sylvestris TaxID=4096 RepID=UPI00388C4DAB
MPNVEALTRDFNEIRTAMWDESGPTVLEKGMLFPDKAHVVLAMSLDVACEQEEHSIDGFSHCRPIISIDGTHVYGKCNIKILIVVAVDANGQIFPLAFAIYANESQETWMLFLNYLKEHVVKQRFGICQISDRHGGILSSVENLPAWQEPHAYHRYCVRHFKANFQKAYPNKDLHDLMWMAATDYQQHKFQRHMEFIRQEDEAAYHGGRRWGTLTTNVLESFNGLLKSVRGLPVTDMVRMSFKQIAERFVERSAAPTSLMERGITNYVDQQYSVAKYLNTYSGQLQPVGAEHYWLPEPFIMVCTKSYLRRIQVQKRMRIRNQMDVSDTIYARSCGICWQTGHDRRKCPLGGNSNQACGGCSSIVPNYQ